MIFSLFWDVTQRGLVITDDSGYSVDTCQSILLNIPEQRRYDCTDFFLRSKKVMFLPLFTVWATHYLPNYSEIRGACLNKFQKHTIVAYIFSLLFIIPTHVPQLLQTSTYNERYETSVSMRTQLPNYKLKF
jgi:hypothetical protein